MRVLFRLLAVLLICCSLAPSLTANGHEQRFRQWLGNEEAGGLVQSQRREGSLEIAEMRDWITLERMGFPISQSIEQRIERKEDGSLSVSWKLSLASMPMEGSARWSPSSPTKLELRVKDAAPQIIELPEGVSLWPGDLDARLRDAAKDRKDIVVRSFSFPLQQKVELDLKCLGPDPLPGFADAIRFKGRTQEGAMAMEVSSWISPVHGELKQRGELMGIPLLVQRSELPPPADTGGPGLFANTLHKLPAHPFLPWIPQAVLRWEGKGDQSLPEDPQQKKLGPNRYELLRTAEPSPEEAAQPPVHGKPSVEDAPFLATSPLLQFRDATFDGLMLRLRAPKDASRWELAQRVTHFVFDWIDPKDYSVGFASALEVAKHPRGDCTEHGVLAVAILRNLGVPARGVVGWIGASDTMGLHFWVEVKLKDRWIPVDPTFDEIPASTLHLKLTTTDLSDLGSVGWDTAATCISQGTWIPEAPWAETVRVQGDRVQTPDGASLRVPGGAWTLRQGTLTLTWQGAHTVQAVPHPPQARLAGSKRFLNPKSGYQAWLTAEQDCFIDLGKGRWLHISTINQAACIELVDRIELMEAEAGTVRLSH